MAHLILTLSNPEDDQDLFPLLIHVYDRPVSQRWLQELKKSLTYGDPEKNQINHLEKNFCFMGFVNSGRDLPYLCGQINKYIGHVNEKVKKEGWSRQYYIDLHFTAEQVLAQEELDRELLNKIHHYFEILSGQVWNRGEFFKKADSKTHYALRQINNLCHEIEHFTRNLTIHKKWPHMYAPYMQFSFMKSERFDLHDEDYEHFTLERNFGQINMHYCQTGKTHWEAFNDDDEEIFRENISGLRYYSAEFDIDLGPIWSPEDLKSSWWTERKRAFREWLIKNDFDPDDKKLGLGTLPVGQMDLAQFGPMTHVEMVETMGRYLNIQKISIHDSEGVTEQFFPYKWSDQGYMEKQFHLLKVPDHVTNY